MRSTLLILSVLAISAITWARPNDLKAVFVEDNEIPAVDKKILKKGVSASFGGYQASAGLGGGPNGGALFASAGIPEAGASAGIGSFGQSSAVAGAGASSSGFEYGGRPPRPIGQYGDGFFDRIFAIPINVLHSVNDYVKTKAAQGQGVYIENGSGSAGAAVSQSGVAASANAGAGAGAGVEGNTGLRFGSSSEEAAVAGSSASASSGSYAGASAAAGTGSGVGFKPGHGGHPDYDRIFNIPISALKSVNDFLNG